MSDKLFLVTYEAVIGRTKEDNNQHSPMQVTFYATFHAPNLEGVNDVAVQYRDPGFVAKIINVQELGEGLTSEEIHAMLDARKVLVEVK
jgi:hypothetical protein